MLPPIFRSLLGLAKPKQPLQCQRHHHPSKLSWLLLAYRAFLEIGKDNAWILAVLSTRLRLIGCVNSRCATFTICATSVLTARSVLTSMIVPPQNPISRHCALLPVWQLAVTAALARIPSVFTVIVARHHLVWTRPSGTTLTEARVVFLDRIVCSLGNCTISIRPLSRRSEFEGETDFFYRPG